MPQDNPQGDSGLVGSEPATEDTATPLVVGEKTDTPKTR